MDRITQLKEFLNENPTDPFLHYALTMEYVKQGDDEQTMVNFEHMVHAFPEYVGTYYHFGKFLEKCHKKDEAEQMYKKGIEIARSKRNMHAMGELQGALNLLYGYDEDDED